MAVRRQALTRTQGEDVQGARSQPEPGGGHVYWASSCVVTVAGSPSSSPEAPLHPVPLTGPSACQGSPLQRETGRDGVAVQRPPASASIRHRDRQARCGTLREEQRPVAARRLGRQVKCSARLRCAQACAS